MSYSAVEGQEHQHHELLFHVRRSVRYHSQRQKFFERWHRIFVFFTLVLSSFSVITLSLKLSWFSLSTLIPPAIVSFLASLEMAVGFVQKAQAHIDFVRLFTDLERKLVAPDGKKRETVAEVWDKILEIEAMEPPILEVLDTICHNKLLQAMGRSGEQVPVRWYKRLFSQLFDLGKTPSLEDNPD